ncbi:hypothetical protein [Phascolarctobacterium sp.]|nr:hypothetical protein [Phascolarctobacterium sp.]
MQQLKNKGKLKGRLPALNALVAVFLDGVSGVKCASGDGEN